MDTQAILKYQRISAQKCRLVANAVRGLKVDRALEFLNYNNKKASRLILKVLESAVANAENNNSQDIDDLMVKNVLIDEGPTGKRHMPRARGRVNEILKRSSHITVIVSDGKEALLWGKKYIRQELDLEYQAIGILNGMQMPGNSLNF